MKYLLRIAVLTLLFIHVCETGFSQESIMTAQPQKTMKEFLASGQLQLNTWYWSTMRPSMNLNKRTFDRKRPLQDREKTRFVEISWFFSPDGKDRTWAACMFDKISLPQGGEEIVLRKVFYIRPRLRTIAIPEEHMRFFIEHSSEPGITLFKEMPEKTVVQIGYDDLAFLRRYYVVRTQKNADGYMERKVEPYEAFPVKYEVFQYFPSGRMYRIIHIESDHNIFALGENGRKYLYYFKEMKYDDNDSKDMVNLIEATPFSDEDYIYWPPNMMHD